MSVQTDYPDSIGQAYAGLPADLTRMSAYSYTLLTGTLRYGSAVALASNAGDPNVECVQPDADNLRFAGIALREHVREGQLEALTAPNGNGETAYLKEKDTVSVGTRGRVYVRVAEDVEAGEKAYFVHQNNASYTIGDFAVSTLAGDATEITNMHAYFRTSALAGELAVIELN